MDFRIFHEYQRLVRRGQAEPLTCNVCSQEYGLVNHHGEPALQCWYCGVLTSPGIRDYDDMVRKVEEYAK